MDPVHDAKLRFLFGRIPDLYQYRDEDGRGELLRADRPEPVGTWPPPSLRLVIANQILDGDPPGTWVAAQRLLAHGLDRHEAMDHLVELLLPFVEAALYDQRPFDPQAYGAALDGAHSAARARQVYLDTAREQGPIAVEALWELVTSRLGLDPDTDAAALEQVHRDLLDDPGGPLTMMPPDLVVHVPALVDGIVLTHRLSAAEHAEGYLDVDADLAGFLRFPEPRTIEGDLHLDDPDDDEAVSWCGPTDWLAPLPLDALLAVRVVGEGEVTITVLDAEPVAPPGVVEALRAAYDAAVAEPWLPVSAEDLVIGMLHRDRDAFAVPMPPLTELAAAAGLERRAHQFAHDESVWKAEETAARAFRMLDLLGPGPESRDALEAFDLLERAEDPAALRRALDRLMAPDVLVAVTEELLGEEDDPGRIAALGVLAQRLIAAAGRSPRAAVAGWVAALAAERDGRVLDAESHLRAASLAGDGWPVVEDRLAWYESDRGDAVAALGRWLGIEAPDDDPDVVALRPFAAARAPEPGRNEPCWCGSGRKYKQCHLGKPAMAPLPDRVGWLYRKAVTFVERRGGAAAAAIDEYAEALAGVDGDLDDGELDSADLDRAYDDPIVIDTALHEGGWFQRFLSERGPLLPPDEATLAASWLTLGRSVFEVTGVRPGDGLTVRDLRTGDLIEITDPTAGPSTRVGGLLCARAVPDGVGHQFVGAAFGVPPGEERILLGVLDEGDEFELLDWLAATTLPPVPTVEPPRPAPAIPPAVAQLRSLRERRWCDEQIPALGDLTPRQAAADPARRDELLTLINSFPEIDPTTGAFGLRPARLRELLGLD